MTALIPKAELHCHLEGVAPPAMIKRLAARNDIALPEGMFDDGGNLAWLDFINFLEAFDRASACIRTPQDYRDVAYEYLASCAREGAIYVETFTSPTHAEQVGLSYGAMLDAIARGIDDAEREFGIVGRMIVTCIRHLGPQLASALAKTVAAEPHPYVVGFGMAGDEAQYTCADFAPAFDIAATAGLGCTVHAGEVCGPQSVRDALRSLPVTRIGHGVRAIDDLDLVAQLSERQIVLEVCPGSNLALGLYDSPSDHPLTRLVEAGCKVTLGSDDPPYFNTSIGSEYARASTDFGFSDAQLRAFTVNAIDGAFVDEATKAKLRTRL